MELDEVRIAWLDLTGGERDAERASMLLDAAERARCDALATAALRERAALRAALRRCAVGRWLGVAPQEVALEPDERGRLRARDEGGTTWVSASSHGNVALVAAARGVLVGADVTVVGASSDPERLLERMATDAEREEVASLGAVGRQLAVARLWARKEAYLKATGEGVGAAMRRCTVPLDDASDWRRCRPSGIAAWWLVEPAATDGLVAAVVCAGGAMPPRSSVFARVWTAADLSAGWPP